MNFMNIQKDIEIPEEYKKEFINFANKCPKCYPPNNQLRREHKPMVSKKMRKKREYERYDYFRRNRKDMF